jgi:ribosomal protein S18 acetylase RimI-like enzyme
MSESSDPDLLRRLWRTERDREREIAHTIEPFEGGFALISPDLDELWIANTLEAESPDLGAAQLATLADELLGGREMQHRLVNPAEPELGDRLTEGFRDLGWDIDRNLFMVLRREPEREGVEAVEVPRERIAGLRRHVARSNPDRTVRAEEQMLIHDERADGVASGRWFATFEEGEPASTCVLFDSDGIGQIENVITRPEAEGRGLGSGVVLAACEASHRAGHDLTFLVADADGWPWKLYERLGFDRLGVANSFLRKPHR